MPSVECRDLIEPDQAGVCLAIQLVQHRQLDRRRRGKRGVCELAEALAGGQVDDGVSHHAVKILDHGVKTPLELMAKPLVEHLARCRGLRPDVDWSQET